jgi:hypothetical protein
LALHGVGSNVQRIVSVMRLGWQEQVMVCGQLEELPHLSIAVQVRVIVLGHVPLTESL